MARLGAIGPIAEVFIIIYILWACRRAKRCERAFARILARTRQTDTCATGEEDSSARLAVVMSTCVVVTKFGSLIQLDRRLTGT